MQSETVTIDPKTKAPLNPSGHSLVRHLTESELTTTAPTHNNELVSIKGQASLYKATGINPGDWMKAGGTPDADSKAQQALTTANQANTTANNAETNANSRLLRSHVVNDLTSGGAAKALSAEQGKVLKIITNAAAAAATAAAAAAAAATAAALAETPPKRPVVVFLSDDGRIEDYIKLKPLADAGAPMTLAIISSKIGTSDYMSASQIAAMAAAGCEVVSHSVTHQDHSNYNKTTADAEVHGSVTALRNLGYPCKHYVYPYGKYNTAAMQSVAEVCDSGSKVGGGINTGVLSSYRLNRVALGSFAGANNSLTYYKSQVDLAKEANGMLIFMLHPWSPEHTSVQQQHLKDVISYCAAQSVQIMTLSNALAVHQNALEQKPTGGEPDRFAVSTDGNVRASSITLKQIDKTGITASSSLDKFPQGDSKAVFGYADSGGWPSGAGTLRTYHAPDGGYSRQVFSVYNSHKVYTRGTSGANAWLPWTTQDQEVLLNSKGLTTKDNPSTWPVGTTWVKHTYGSTHVLPGVAGMLKVEKPTDERGFARAWFYTYNSENTYVSAGKTNDTWSPPKLVTLT